MIKLETASPLKVAGSRSEIAAVGPIPGSTPTRVPMTHPIKAKIKFSGRRAIESPKDNICIQSILT
jgi:hypothetical protein